jgi:hypothetical protein
MSQDDLAARIARLEAESQIRRIKSRYLNACDSKDVAAIRACFIPDAVLDFPPVGEFGVDGLIDVFTQLAVNTPIVDQHHAHNADIRVLDADNAEANWHLSYTMYHPETGVFRLLSTFYHDRYTRTPNGWLISYSNSMPRAIIEGKVEAGSVTAHWVDPKATTAHPE